MIYKKGQCITEDNTDKDGKGCRGKDSSLIFEGAAFDALFEYSQKEPQKLISGLPIVWNYRPRPYYPPGFVG